MFSNFLLGATDPDVMNHLVRTTSPSAALALDLENLILGLKADDLWDKLDVLCVAHPTEADSLLNLKGVSTGAPDSINQNGCAFAADRGFTTSTSGGAYIDLDTTEDAAPLYLQDARHFFVYTRTFNSGGTIFSADGGITRILLYETATPDQAAIFVGNAYVTIDQDVPIGFICGSAVGTNLTRAALNETQGANAVSSHAVLEATDTILIGAFSGTASVQVNDQFSAWGIGGGLGSAQIAAYESRIRTYLTARGAEVYP